MTASRGLRGVLFDLDGTLLDTAPDMAAALNRLRVAEGLEALPFAQIRPLVSHGAPRLLAPRHSGNPSRAPRIAASAIPGLLPRGACGSHAAVRRFRRGPRGHRGVGPALGHRHQQAGLAARAARWPKSASPGAARCLVAGDTLAERKPHPLPLLHAAGLLGLEPRECVYVGDAERDVQAARNAGMIPLVAGFGYLGDGEDPAAWQAEAIFARPEELIDWLELRR